MARACFLAVLPIFMTAVTFMAQHYMLLFSTAFAGSYVFIVGIDFLAHTGYLTGIKGILDRTHQAPYYISTHVYVMLATTIALCLISLGWQHFRNKGNNTNHGGHADDDGDDDTDEEVLPAAMTAGAAGGFSSRSSYAGGSGNGHHGNNNKNINSNGHGSLGKRFGNGNGNGNGNGGSSSHGFEKGNGLGSGHQSSGSGNAMHNLPHHSYPSSRSF